MNELIKVNIKNENGKLLVGSRDIAIGLEKEHKDVLRKIEDVLTVGEFSEREFMTNQGNKYKEYLLDKNAFILLVMNYTGYNDFKRAYIKKFDDMEKQLRLNVPQTYPEALRMYADEVERRELAEKETQKAIREKSWIGNRREATAMATASVKSKEAEKLKVKLDLEMSYASVKKVELETGRKYSWQNLKKYCLSAGLGWNKAFDANYGSVNSYPAEAWKNVYGVEL